MRRMDPLDTQTTPETGRNPLQLAIDEHGIVAVARAVGRSYQAVGKWLDQGRMPRTEWSGETAYSDAIERLTAGKVTRTMLLAPWTKAPQQPAQHGGGGAAPEQGRKGGTQLAHQAG